MIRVQYLFISHVASTSRLRTSNKRGYELLLSALNGTLIFFLRRAFCLHCLVVFIYWASASIKYKPDQKMGQLLDNLIGIKEDTSFSQAKKFGRNKYEEVTKQQVKTTPT